MRRRWFLIEGWPGSTAGAVARDPDEYIVGEYFTRRAADREAARLNRHVTAPGGVGWRVTSAHEWRTEHG